MLTYMGQGYQAWILYNIDVPESYHWTLFIYSYPNIDFYPMQGFFSSWEKAYYGCYDDMIKENFYHNKVRFWNDLDIEVPVGYSLWKLEHEFRDSWTGITPFIVWIFRRFMLLIVGKIPELPLVLFIWFYLWLFIWPLYYYISTYIAIKSHKDIPEFYFLHIIRQVLKYYDLFSKK